MSEAAEFRSGKGHKDENFPVASFMLKPQHRAPILTFYRFARTATILGGPVANFAGLLHMTVHSLTKSAIFFAAGHAAQKAGTQMIDGIR